MKTTKELATAVGVSPRRLLQIAKARGITADRRIGAAWIWSVDPESLRPNTIGRPKKLAPPIDPEPVTIAP